MSKSTGKSTGRTHTPPGPAGATPPPVDDPDAIRADIAQTRAELGDSVQELADRADVKARAREKVAEVKDRAAQATDVAKDTAQVAAERATQPARQVAGQVRRRPAPYAGVVAGLAAVAGTVALVRRRRAAKARARRWWSR
jgi:ElaB/YqjD/DUF883 family membrane-anchored ribosome-binding protein